MLLQLKIVVKKLKKYWIYSCITENSNEIRVAVNERKNFIIKNSFYYCFSNY